MNEVALLSRRQTRRMRPNWTGIPLAGAIPQKSIYSTKVAIVPGMPPTTMKIRGWINMNDCIMRLSQLISPLVDLICWLADQDAVAFSSESWNDAPEEVDHHHTAEQAESMTKYWQIFENNRWHWIRRSSCDDHDDLTEQHEKWWECHHKNTATTTSPTSSSLFIMSLWIGMLLLRPTTTTCALSQLKCTATTVCLWELQPPIYCHRSARSPSNGKDRMANFHPIFLLVFVTILICDSDGVQFFGRWVGRPVWLLLPFRSRKLHCWLPLWMAGHVFGNAASSTSPSVSQSVVQFLALCRWILNR